MQPKGHRRTEEQRLRNLEKKFWSDQAICRRTCHKVYKVDRLYPEHPSFPEPMPQPIKVNPLTLIPSFSSPEERKEFIRTAEYLTAMEVIHWLDGYIRRPWVDVELALQLAGVFYETDKTTSQLYLRRAMVTADGLEEYIEEFEGRSFDEEIKKLKDLLKGVEVFEMLFAWNLENRDQGRV